tara:strand:+ start:768 stop:986 length:219 start_codon:yes stop_codon:yes gene_type:complete
LSLPFNYFPHTSPLPSYYPSYLPFILAMSVALVLRGVFELLAPLLGLGACCLNNMKEFLSKWRFFHLNERVL